MGQSGKTSAQKILKRSTEVSGKYRLGGSGSGGWWDCSAYVAYCVGYSIPFDHSDFTTANEREYLIDHWGFKDVTNQVSLGSGTGMKPGDVLIYKNSPYGHTVIYIGNGLIRGANGSTANATPVPNEKPVGYKSWTYCIRPPGEVYIDTWNGKKKTR